MTRLTARENGQAYIRNFGGSYVSIVSRLAAYEDAEEQGRLVVLPCKVGDTVWAYNSTRVVCGKVESIHQNCVGGEVGRWVITAYFQEFYGTKESGLTRDLRATTKYVGFNDFGKTVFLTREEADAALAERERGNDK